jgi:hypothetical protein
MPPAPIDDYSMQAQGTQPGAPIDDRSTPASPMDAQRQQMQLQMLGQMLMRATQGGRPQMPLQSQSQDLQFPQTMGMARR